MRDLNGNEYDCEVVVRFGKNLSDPKVMLTIVRCRYCVHWREDESCTDYLKKGYCESLDRQTHMNWFCADCYERNK